MPRSSLKVLRKPVSRCNNSSPRYMRENHYAISCSVYEFLRFSNYKMSITLPMLINGQGHIHIQLQNYKKIFDKRNLIYALAFNFFVGQDHLLGKLAKQGVPLSSNGAVNLGMNFLF